ncbi:MAG: transposase-like protein [Ilumatobacter sp.]
MVRGDVVPVLTEERHLCTRASTGDRVRVLRDGVGVDAQAETRNGATRSRASRRRWRVGGSRPTFLGGRSKTRSGARYDNKSEVIIAIERQHPKGFGRVRLAHIETSNRKHDLFDFVQHTIAHGTTLYTDGDPSYAVTAKKLQITHVPIAMVHSPNSAHVELPGVHLVASLRKRWLAGTMHDGQSDQHLDYYLDEFTFRFNRRTSRSRGMLWYRLVQQAVNTDPHPLAVLQHKM